MDRRKLGSQGLEVSAIGLGCMGLTGTYGDPLPEAAAIAVVHRAVELGITLFDSAQLYGPFTNEVMLGKALRPVRDRVIIATKFGYDLDSGARTGVNSRPADIVRTTEASLVRLGIETIDLLYQHRVDPAVPIEDVAGTVGELVKAGKVRFFGLSECAAATLRRAHAVHPVSAVQSEYSLWTRGVEAEVLPACRELGVGFVPFSPLGRGFLSATLKPGTAFAKNDLRAGLDRFVGDAIGHNYALVETLARLAGEKGRTAAQMALAWLLHQGEDIVPIPGTTRPERLAENVAAARIRLTPEDLAAIEAAVPADRVMGPRYSPAQEARTNL